MLHGDCKYAARGFKFLHRVCKSAANGLQIWCTGATNMLHMAFNYAARGAATVLNRTCNHAAQGFQICCTVLAIMLHRVCNYAAQGLQLCCTGPVFACIVPEFKVAQGQHMPAQCLQLSCKSLHWCCTTSCTEPVWGLHLCYRNAARGYIGPAIMLHRACDYAAQAFGRIYDYAQREGQRLAIQ